MPVLYKQQADGGEGSSSAALPIIDPAMIPQDDDIERELAKFEAEERERLGLNEKHDTTQYREKFYHSFTKAQRPHTTVLLAGLTVAQDDFMCRAMNGRGYRFMALDCPDVEALRMGKEFGNRGQCNPTYFTVGNLIKFLCYLRDEQGLPAEQIIHEYAFMTVGACGPCRFGTYLGEFRKALRDSGFEGFRVTLFQQTGGLSQVGKEEQGVEMNLSFFVGLLSALLLGDVINVLGYRIRPYEVEAGSTDAALDRCKALIGDALEERKGLLGAMRQVRKIMGAVKVDRSMVRPRVSLIGEFWAMTTEGDGNYKLQRFLESEGAEVDIQTVTAWILYMVWEANWDTRRREMLKRDDTDPMWGQSDTNPWKKKVSLWAAEWALRGTFHGYAALMGLRDYHLPDMDLIAETAHEHYDNAMRGGEGHMEVGKLILNVLHQKVNMTLSVKPFGCMPSSGVSDGVQTLVTALHPSAIFLPLETSGDGAVNVYSRVQMMLFKARQVAQREFEAALGEHTLTADGVQEYLSTHRMGNALFRAGHYGPNTAVDTVHEVAKRLNRTPRKLAKRAWSAAKQRLARA